MIKKSKYSQEELDEIWQSIKNKLIEEKGLDEDDMDDESIEDEINRETDDIFNDKFN